jgi:DNA primase
MDIKEIKAKLSIRAVLQHYNIKVDKTKQINCPFHNDKTPSMQVYEDKNMVYCHSSNCKCGGKLIDGIDFIMHLEKFTKHQAILKAQHLIGEILQTPVKTIATMIQEQINYEELFIKLQQCYIRNDKAINYATSRNINHAKLEIGYNTPTGTVSKHLKNCIVFPLKNLQNEITSLYGRSIDNNDKAKHYYTKDRKGMYHNATEETIILIITESIIDSATIQVHTAYETLALFGTNGFNTEHEELLKSLPNLKEIIFFLDGDEAGKQAVTKHSETIKQLLPNIKISNVNTPNDEDINELTQSHDAEILNHLINEREILFSSEKSNEIKSVEIPINTITSKLDVSNEDYLAFTYENIIMSIIGGVATYPIDKLKITLGLQRNDSPNKLHKLRQSNLDLYNEEQLQKFIRTASEKLETGSKALQYGIAELIELLEDHRQQKTNREKPKVEPQKTLSNFRKEELKKILQRKDLYQYINNLIAQVL